MSSDSSCTVTGTVGVIVQLALAVLVIVVLVTEYVVEHLNQHCKKSTHKPRNLRTFWFDSFKICTGALVSHAFNIGVSVLVTSAYTSNECAVYALAFYYEACGVPFVQLLQYGIIQYSQRMARRQDLTSKCRWLWYYISTPGIYKKQNRYKLDCGQCPKLTFIILIIVAVGLSLLAGYLFYKVEGSDYDFLDVSVIILVFIFIVTAVMAPNSSLTQTFGWVCVKMIEKTVWSILALSQTKQFAKWSLAMSTDDATTDAWVFIAIIPIIMNAFMFFMFSRISRLKIPCLDVKLRQKLDEKLDDAIDDNDEIDNNNGYSDYDINNNISNIDNNNNNGYNGYNNEYKNSNNIKMNKQIDMSSDNNGNKNENNNMKNKNNNKSDKNGKYDSTKTNNMNEQLHRRKSTQKEDYSFLHETPADLGKFDVGEAIKVGIIYSLLINVTLLVIAIIYLTAKGGSNVWILGITMLLAPLIIGGIGILFFRQMIDGERNIFFCCCIGSDSSYHGMPDELSLPRSRQHSDGDENA